MKSRLRELCVVMPICGSALVCAAPAFAQIDESEPIREIIVTAQHREERLQDVPIAMSVLNGDELVQSGVYSLQDLAARTPGLVVTNSVNYGFAPLSIRGVGGANGGGNIFADEPVAVYQDGAFVARLRMSTVDLFDIDRIEVLRGPQGVLFGRNSTAGAVMIHTAEPTENLSGFVRASASSIESFRLQGAVSGPLDDEARILVRLAASGSLREGFGTNVAGDRLNGGRDARGRMFLRFAPDAGIRLDLIGEISRSRNEPGTIAIADLSDVSDENTGVLGGNVVYPFVPRQDLQDVVEASRYALNRPTYSELRGNSLTARGELELGDQTLVSITNYRNWRLSGAQDSDGTAIDPPEPAFVQGEIENVGDNAAVLRDSQFSQELRLASGPSGRFSWMLGGFYFQETNRAEVAINNRLAGPGGGGTVATFRTSQKTRSLAGFFDLTFRLTDALSLSGGLRYTNERKHFLNSLTVEQINAFDPPGDTFFAARQLLVRAPDLDRSRDETNLSHRLVLDWEPAEGLHGFVSYNSGFKSGGFNAFRGIDPEFASERNDAFEIGLKTQVVPWLQVDLTAFRYAYRNMQVRTPVPTGGVGIETLARARSQGLEMDLRAVPLRGLNFDASLGLLDTSIREGRLSALRNDSFVFGTAPPVTQIDVSGNDLTRAPHLQFYAAGEYQWAVGDLQASAQLAARYQGGVYFLETNQQSTTFRGEAWHEIDLRLAVEDPEDGWEIALLGRNLTDSRAFTQITAFFGLPNGALNRPRSVELAFALRF
ncbi:TonB-dependent receptor [Aurantiacibacter hainanensis]|uniref:TonB-dependent receptor n=1 Tax=Aurantiacibacter hainanensis TaxID=3076114 RepID=UPI0030C71433